MRDDLRIPDLTFPSVQYGQRETPWDLCVLLYRGGAKAYVKTVRRLIASGSLGGPLIERLDLVVKIHDAIHGRLVGGASTATARNNIRGLREFFGWAEQVNAPLTLEHVERTYLTWSDALVYRRRVTRDLTASSAYSKASWVGEILDVVLDRQTALISRTRLKPPSYHKAARASSAEKESLEQVFTFGHLLQDLCDGLPFEVVLKGQLPVRIALRHGGEVVEWSGYTNGKAVETATNAAPTAVAHRPPGLVAWEADGTLRTRSPLVNLRLEAELLMFIGQTGMNLAQAHQLKIRHFSYASYLDGYQVKDRKERRGGEVLFEIFKEYKPHFERYLAWRRDLFHDAELLFPFVRSGRAEHMHPQFRLRFICKKLNIRFVPPRTLRSARVNWLLRRSGDPDLTAALAQHTKETLLGVYERPSQQRAMGEVMRFWSKNDPGLASTPVAPGQCDGRPVPMPGIPKHAPEPDCVRPSGCLWCEHHRDIDSQDYVWALASFRHLKIIELSKWQAPAGTQDVHPAALVVERISQKLRWFGESRARRKAWVDEALTRIDEGTYHRDWHGAIEIVEGAK